MKTWVWQSAIAAAGVFWLAWVFQEPILNNIWWTGWQPEKLGQWGDTFGALNALFAAAGFIAVLTTLRYQQREIENQQRQIDRANVDRQRLRKEQEQAKFDTAFFQLLELLRQIRTEIRFRENTPVGQIDHSGAAALKAAEAVVSRAISVKSPVDRNLTRAELSDIYLDSVHNKSEDALGPYFRVIYTILKRIDRSKLTEREKIGYGNLLRSQLGSAEAGIIALNAFIPDAKDFKDYVERYRIPRYLPENTIKRAVIDHYDPRTWESRGDK